MKASNPFWKEKLGELPEPSWGEEIDIFETQIALRQRGQIDEKLFAETRLRRGVYGQRYDNGQRHDGSQSRSLAYPSKDYTKGPSTLWDAPGMQRIKVPFGGLSAEQCEVMADVAEEYSDGIAHVTTRQDFQLHFVHIEDTPALMRRLAAVGITTREACGNSVRNITACPRAGCCREESFDVTPYAKALTYFLLGHHDVQDFGRKFKIAFSGCKDNACGLVGLHDLGLIAAKRLVDGQEQRGFALYVGGGLGAVPYQAKLLEEFLPQSELLPMAQAISRVFARLGEKKNRARARIKFLVAKLGIEEFRRLVHEERKQLPPDHRWDAYLQDIEGYYQEGPAKPPGNLNGSRPEGFAAWFKDNVYRQKQEGYAIVSVKLPLGDITSRQLRALADIGRKYLKDTLRTTVEQNIVLRWVSEADLPQLYLDLQKVGLAEAGAETITDVVACPGTDTCKLGISSSRGLAGELRRRFLRGDMSGEIGENGDSKGRESSEGGSNGRQGKRGEKLEDVIRHLRIKVSGCFNSCGQHHVADLGFYGVSRKVAGRTVPHFQVVLGGQWEQNAASYGLPILAVPSRNIPLVVQRIAARFAEDSSAKDDSAKDSSAEDSSAEGSSAEGSSTKGNSTEDGFAKRESFQQFIERLGKAEIKKMLIDLTEVPPYEKDRSYYSDWRDPREYTTGDIGVGECAGEVVSRVDMDLAAAERELFEAQLALEANSFQKAGELAYQAMIDAARALVKVFYLDVPADSEIIISQFRQRFCDTELFYDPYAGGKFAAYLFAAHRKSPENFSPETARHRIEEAGLFIEAAHSCSVRMSTPAPAVAK